MIAKYIFITKCQIVYYWVFKLKKSAMNWWIWSTYCIKSFLNGVKTVSKRIVKTGLKE